jgi:hypothetical protein
VAAAGRRDHRPVRTRILVVANRSVATPALLTQLRARAQAGPCAFFLLVPDAPPGRAGDWLLRHAVKLFTRATGEPVDGRLARGAEPFTAIAAELADHEYDEVIVSTLAPWGSRWLRDGLPDRVEELGVPVTVVTPAGQRAPVTPV